MKIVKLLLIFIAFFMMLSSCQVEDSSYDDEGTDGEHEKAPLIHIHTIGEEEIENLVPATCENDGSYESIYHCTECNKELSRVTETIESEGHSPLDPVLEEELLNTCTEDGKRVTVIYCSVCEAELSREEEILASEGHKESSPVVVYDTDGICKTEGSCTKTISCTVCHEVLSSTTEVVPAIGHKWADDKCEKCGIDFSAEESLEFALSEDGSYYIITGIGTFYKEELIIPSEYNGIPVKEIGDYAFQNCTFVTYAFIPKSIVRLGYGAAYGCTSVEEIVLEDRSGWSLYDGQEDPKIIPVPSFLLISLTNKSEYFYLLVDKDRFALVKK